jgi:hypothetical protein
VVNTLVPTLAQAVVTGSGQSDWMQVCSVTGVVWIRADAGSDALRGAAGQPGSHPVDKSSSMQCPWCGFHGGIPGLPSCVQGWQQAQAPAPFEWPAFSSAARASVLRLGAPARAPPVAS